MHEGSVENAKPVAGVVIGSGNDVPSQGRCRCKTLRDVAKLLVNSAARVQKSQWHHHTRQVP